MAGFAEYAEYDGLGLADLIRRGQITSLEAIEAAIARIDALNPRLNAVIHRMDESARAAARPGVFPCPGPAPVRRLSLMASLLGDNSSETTRLIERATEKALPLIIISTSGGARMYEGMFSLMQMAKTCGALAYHAKARLPYISVLTHPTTAGVMASFATVGDLIIAEPAAMIGFAGPRVIKDTTQAELPPGFQTAEFLLDHGLIDAIIPRKELKPRLIEYLSYLTAGQKRA